MEEKRPPRPTQEMPRLQPEAQAKLENVYREIIGSKLKVATEFKENAAVMMFYAYQAGAIQLEDLIRFMDEMQKYLDSHEVKDHRFIKIVQEEITKLHQLLDTPGETLTGGK